MSESPSDTSREVEFLPALHLATKANHFLLWSMFLVYADCILLTFHQPALVALMSGPFEFNGSAAIKLAVVFVSFSLFAAILLLPFLELFMAIWLTFVFPVLRKASPTPKPQRNLIGYVSMQHLKEQAHLKKDSYLLDLYNKAQASEDNRQENEHQFSIRSFGLLVLICWNAFISTNQISGLAALTAHLEIPHLWAWIAGALLCFTVFRIQVYRPSKSVYCLTLFNELEQAKRDNSPLYARSRPYIPNVD